MIYSVNYDLRKPGRNYQNLYDALRRYPHCRSLESLWLIQTTASASDVRDALRMHIDQSDGLLVIQAGPSWASCGISQESTQWLHRVF
jgi:hypothetical protein